MLQYYDFNAQTTGASFPVASPGRFLYYLSGSAGGADSTIAVRAGNTGQSVLLKPGQSVRLADSDKTVDTWFISNYAKAQPILGQLLVGDGFFDDNRISGSVEVIDGGKSRTLAGAAFMGGVQGGSVAAQYTHVQVWNPAASGKNVIVESVTYSSGGNGGIYIRTNAAALANLTGNGPAKLANGAASAAELRYASLGAFQGGGNMLVLNLAAGQFSTFNFKEPVVLKPGNGILVIQTIGGNDVNAAFEWYEESV